MKDAPLTTPKVLVTPHLLQSDEGPHVAALESAGLARTYPPEGMNTLEPENIASLLTSDVQAIIASTEPFTRELLEMSSLRVIARLGVGYDSIDVNAATDLGIAVTITPGTLEASVAEQTMALLLALTRDVLGRDHEVRVGVWKRTPMPRLDGRTFGIVGLGRIGQAVVPRAQGFGMKVIGYDPYANAEQVSSLGVELRESYEDIFREADVVSLHLPCTEDTRLLVNADTLGLMKPGAILLNTSRGGLVDESALHDALNEGHLFGAGLDVFQQEPCPVDNPLLECHNVVASTHVGGIDRDATKLAGNLAATCIADLCKGVWPERCVVNRELQESWKWAN